MKQGNCERGSTKPLLLVFPRLSADEKAVLAKEYNAVFLRNGAGLEDVSPDLLRIVRCVLTTGPVGFDEKMFAHCPCVEAIISFGAGYDRVDLDSARHRNVVLATGAGANANSVAEHAMALLLSLVRRISMLDRHVRNGGWKLSDVPPQISGKKMGILGLGAIGREVARMAEGFGMTIGYTGRSPKAGVNYTYFASVQELADFADVLLVSCKGGSDTQHLVNASVLDSLGANGFLVNVARGSVVDTRALVNALNSGAIGGAALDVFETEPEIPDDLKRFENVVMTPHMAGASPESRRAMLDMALKNLRAFFAGEPMPGRVHL